MGRKRKDSNGGTHYKSARLGVNVHENLVQLQAVLTNEKKLTVTISEAVGIAVREALRKRNIIPVDKYIKWD